MSKTIAILGTLLLLAACASAADVHVNLAPIHATLDASTTKP